MIEFTANIYINRPVEQVFAWLTTAENQTKFDKSALEMELLTPAPWQTGSQFREVRNIGGRKTEVFAEIVDLVPNRRFVASSKTGPGWLGRWEFAPEGAGTRLNWSGRLTMKGLGRLIEPVIDRKMRPQLVDQFAALPGVIEKDMPVVIGEIPS